MRQYRLLGLLGLILWLAACTPPEPTPVPTLPPVPPTAAVIIVTRPPIIQETPTPSVSFDVGPYVGEWRLNFRYQFDGGPTIAQIRFVGGYNLRVNADGSVDGQGMLTTAVSHPGCAASVLEDGLIHTVFAGRLQQGANGVEMVFTLRAAEPTRRERYLLNCNTFTEPAEIEQQTLWPALDALDAQPYVLAMQPGAVFQKTDDLAAVSGQILQGTLMTEIRLSR